MYSTSGYSNNSSMPPHLLPKPTYFNSYNSNYHRGLGMNNNPNFVLSSYDDDFTHPCNYLIYLVIRQSSHSPKPQLVHTSSEHVHR